MEKVNHGFRNQTKLQQLVLCEQRLQNIQKLDPALRIDIQLDELEQHVAEARESYDAVEQLRHQLKAAIARRNEQLKRACRDITHACDAAGVRSHWDDAVLLATGVALKKAKTSVGQAPAPTYLRGRPGDNEGEVALTWKRPVRRCSFMIQMQRDGESEWQNFDTAGSTSALLEKLPSGAKLWFRVCAVNAHGPGPWSQPVAVRVK